MEERIFQLLRSIEDSLENMDLRLENIEGWIADYVLDEKKESELKD
jgi:hypothetical protein